MTWASGIYEGFVRHRRRAPVAHEFRYAVFMMYLDLEELPHLFDGCPGWAYEKPALAAFRRRDYLGDARTPLDKAVRDLVAERSGLRPGGPIRMLTNLCYFGYCFNPVTFYYCFDHDGRNVATIVAEITNTPWDERHQYVLTAAANLGDDHRQRFTFTKSFHISPFMDMGLDYDWRFTAPGDSLVVRMENASGGQRFFDATLTARRMPITRANLRRMLWRYPAMTAQVVAGIHWQAFLLWRKGCPYYEHPRYRPQATPTLTREARRA